MRKIKHIAEEQVSKLRDAGFREDTIKQRMKELGMPDSKLKALGFETPEPKPQVRQDMEGEKEFLSDVANFLEYAYRELSPVKSRYADTVGNMMNWNRKIKRRVDALKQGEV